MSSFWLRLPIRYEIGPQARVKIDVKLARKVYQNFHHKIKLCEKYVMGVLYKDASWDYGPCYALSNILNYLYIGAGKSVW